MGTFGTIMLALVDVGSNYAKKYSDEKENRDYASRMGWKEDGAMVCLMDYASESKRKKNGYKF